MTELAAALEATALAQFLKGSRWVYPAVNAGHILGLAVLVGAVLPLDASVIRGRPALWLRGWAASGLALAVVCGALLFLTQAGDYLGNPVFLAKMAVLAVALLNAALALRRPRVWQVALSLVLWPAVLVLGRFTAYV